MGYNLSCGLSRIDLVVAVRNNASLLDMYICLVYHVRIKISREESLTS